MSLKHLVDGDLATIHYCVVSKLNNLKSIKKELANVVPQEMVGVEADIKQIEAVYKRLLK